MTTRSTAQFPNRKVVGHDLDPNADGDLTVTGACAATEAVILAATSTDNNTWSASLDFVDGEGNVFQSLTASDLSLSSVTEGSTTITRNAPKVNVTLTSEETAGTQNRVNVYVDAHR